MIRITIFAVFCTEYTSVPLSDADFPLSTEEFLSAEESNGTTYEIKVTVRTKRSSQAKTGMVNGTSMSVKMSLLLLLLLMLPLGLGFRV